MENWVVSRYEINIISFAGVIRGTVTFALISSIDVMDFGQGMLVIESSVLAIVIITTILLETVMPAFIIFNLDLISKSKKYSNHPSTRKSIHQVEDLEKRKSVHKYFRKFEEDFLKQFFYKRLC